MMGQLWGLGELCEVPKVPTLKGTEVESLSYVQCFLYLVSSSVNVSTFHVTWLDTLWTDLVYSTKERTVPPNEKYMHTYHTISECFSSHSHGNYGKTNHTEIRLLMSVITCPNTSFYSSTHHTSTFLCSDISGIKML